MSKAQFAQRRDGRVAALQFLYAWSLNSPKNLAEDLRVFFENMEQPRDHYAFGEELTVADARVQAAISGLREITGPSGVWPVRVPAVSCLDHWLVAT